MCEFMESFPEYGQSVLLSQENMFNLTKLDIVTRPS